MRIIAGTFRSRMLNAPSGMKTRPTSDRLRETLFNVLAPRIEGARFIDLYAGSGAVGIEAISRGAKFVWFVENAPPAVNAIRENLSTLKIASGYALESHGVATALDALAKKAIQIDLVFLDPPYEAAEEYDRTLGLLGSRAASLLADNARVIAEHHSKTDLAERYGRLERVRVLKQGDAALSFYAIEPDTLGKG